jgi:hypothetical protein
VICLDYIHVITSWTCSVSWKSWRCATTAGPQEPAFPDSSRIDCQLRRDEACQSTPALLTDTTAAPSGWLHPFHPSRDRGHTDTECFGCFSHAVQVVIDAQCSLSELDRIHVLVGRLFEAVTMPAGSVSNHPYTAVAASHPSTSPSTTGQQLRQCLL